MWIAFKFKKLHIICGWLGRAMVLGSFQYRRGPTALAYSRARACSACSRCGIGGLLLWLFVCHVVYPIFPFLMPHLLWDNWTWLKYWVLTSRGCLTIFSFDFSVGSNFEQRNSNVSFLIQKFWTHCSSLKVFKTIDSVPPMRGCLPFPCIFFMG